MISKLYHLQVLFQTRGAAWHPFRYCLFTRMALQVTKERLSNMPIKAQHHKCPFCVYFHFMMHACAMISSM